VSASGDAVGSRGYGVTIARRWVVASVMALALVFALAFALLRPAPAPLSDAQYIAIAKATPQAQLFFTRYDSPCQVVRGWNVMVSCDYVAAPGSPTQKLRVYIDSRTSQVIEVEAQFD